MKTTDTTTTEFDQIFEQLEAPEYPATCDQCGEVGTNASMVEHACAAGKYQTGATGECTSLPWRVGGHPQDSGSDWRQILADTQPFGPAFVGSALKADARLIVRAVNNHVRLIETLEQIANYYVAPATDREMIREMRKIASAALTQARQ